MPPAAQCGPRGAGRRGHRPSGRVCKRVPLAHGATETSRRRLRRAGATEIARGYRRAETSASEGRIAREIARRARSKSSGHRVRAATHSSAGCAPPAHLSGRHARPASRAAVRMPAPAGAGVPAPAGAGVPAPTEARVPAAVEAAACVRASSTRAYSMGASAPVRAFAAPGRRRIRHTSKDKRCDRRR
jgi:hypothetical protein